MDIQFYKESGIAAEDINFKGRHKMNEMDEKENKTHGVAKEKKSTEEKYTLDHTIVVYLMGP